MVTAIQWIKIILYIIDILTGGEDKATAVSMASQKFGIPESEIWNHGGF